MKRAEWNKVVQAWEGALSSATVASATSARLDAAAESARQAAVAAEARARVAEADARQAIMAYGEASQRKEREGIDEEKARDAAQEALRLKP